MSGLLFAFFGHFLRATLLGPMLNFWEDEVVLTALQSYFIKVGHILLRLRLPTPNLAVSHGCLGQRPGLFSERFIRINHLHRIVIHGS